jgi:hypothetical protein
VTALAGYDVSTRRAHHRARAAAIHAPRAATPLAFTLAKLFAVTAEELFSAP